MANKVILSEQWKVNVTEWLKGAGLFVGTPVLYLLQEIIPGWNIDPIFKAAISAFLTYILQTLFEKPKVTTVYSSNEKAEEISEEIKAKQ